jgi:hypothetical protein
MEVNGMSITAMKMALEALELCPASVFLPDRNKREAAITALRNAIEQAEKQEPTGKQSLQVEQEPVAWANINKHGDITHTSNKRMPWSKTPLYTTPPAAPVQEPVAFNRKAVWNVLFEVWNQNISANEGLQKLQDLYTTPPAAQRQPLTEEQIVQVLGDVRESISGNVFLAFARAIEAAHGIKENT